MKGSFQISVWFWITLLIVVIGVGIAIVLGNRSPEPRLNGMSIQELAEEFGRNGYYHPERHQEICEFIKHTGEPGYRELSRVLLLRCPKPKNSMERWLIVAKRFCHVSREVDYRATQNAAHGAIDIFYRLGTNAAPAIPYLAPAMKNRYSASCVSSVLAVLGDGALPILSEALTNHDPIIQAIAMSGLHLPGANPKPLLPLIKNITSSTNVSVSLNALQVVSNYGRFGSNDLLVLEKLSTNADPWTSARAWKMMTNFAAASTNPPSRLVF